MNVGLAVHPVILAGTAILALGVVAGGVDQRLRVPSLGLFLALGMLIGDDGLELIEFSDAGLAQSIAVSALVAVTPGAPVVALLAWVTSGDAG